MNKIEFYSSLKLLNYPIDEKKQRLFEKYLELIIEVNSFMDLTANTEEEEIIEKNFYDSILSLSNYDYNFKTLVDIGSGAGFPGILYAITYPNLKVTLVEPMHKRVEFLKRVKKELNLDNVEIICSRVEDYIKTDKTRFDYASARGVAKLNILLELIIPLLKVNGIFIALKGKRAYEEEQEAQNAIKLLNVKRIDAKEFLLPTNKEIRINLYYKKEQETNSKYPRNYATIKKKPL